MSDGDLPLLVARLAYRPRWQFHLEYGYTSAAGRCGQVKVTGTGTTATTATTATAATAAITAGAPARLIICAWCEDTAKPGTWTWVEFPFAVPDTEPAGGWHRWLLDCCLAADRHEACEWFRIAGHRPFYPEHGNDQIYDITDRGLPGRLPKR